MPDLDALDCQPAQVRGRVSTLERKGMMTPKGYIFIDPVTEVPLLFDRSRDHDEPLLIHQQCGGGKKSFDLLKHLTLVPEVAARVRAALDALPHDYIALHIRNTDYQTDLDMVTDFLRKRGIRRDLVLCTDQPSLITRIRAALPGSTVLQPTVNPLTRNGPMHVVARAETPEVRREVAINSLIELCVLAGASLLFVATLHSQSMAGGPRVFAKGAGKLSGFSQLASHIGHKKALLRRLLGEAGSGLLAGVERGWTKQIEPPDTAPEPSSDSAPTA